MLPVPNKVRVIISALLALLYRSQWEQLGPSLAASCCARGTASTAHLCEMSCVSLAQRILVKLLLAS